MNAGKTLQWKWNILPHYGSLCRRFRLVISEKGLENSTENSILESKRFSIIKVSFYSAYDIDSETNDKNTESVHVGKA